MEHRPSRSPLWDTVPPGGKEIVPIDVCTLGGGETLRLLLSVARGTRPGKSILFLGGVHGDEYEGPLALWQLMHGLDPSSLRGTLIMLPVANPPAYAAGQRVSSVDQKDLARTFPGNPSGSVTEQIADTIQRKIIAHVDFLCDFHSAGRLYRLMPWAGYGLSANRELLEIQRGAARATGYPLLWGTPLLPGRTLSAAEDCGIPAIYVEAPGEGRIQEEDVERNRQAALNLLMYFGLLDGSPRVLREPNLVEDNKSGAGYLQGQIVARQGGFFLPRCQLGDSLSKHSVFGEIRDPVGRVLETISAPLDGSVVFLRTFPMVTPGESLGTIMERS